MLHKHWAMWLVIGGLAIDIIDGLTDPGGRTNPQGGVFYGPSGFLSGFYNSLPGDINPGELIAAVGAVGLLMHKG